MFNQFFRGLRAKKNPPVITTEGLMTTYRINMARMLRRLTAQAVKQYE